MNVWGQRERSWRKARKRGVSPIIATILLVAITVVLAAVLYVLISGLTKGPGNTPLGSAFAAGNPTLLTGTATTNVIGCKTGDYCYTLTIEQASSGLTLSSLGLEVRTSAGIAATITGISVVSIQSTGAATTLPATCAAAICNGGTGTTAWTYGTTGVCATGCGAGTQVSSATDFIYLDIGTTSPTGTGLQMVALAQGSYSGTVIVNLP